MTAASRGRLAWWWTLLLLARASSAESLKRYVEISKDGTSFSLDGKDFYVHGFNQPQMMTHAADESGRGKILEVLGDAELHGFNVMRMWAFNDGHSQWNSLQLYPGVFDEKVFRALDYVLHESRRHKIRVLLSLTNHWNEYGGTNQYVQWAKASANASQQGGSSSFGPDAFYSSVECRRLYKNFVAAVLERRNVYTGIAYKDDDYIFGWDLINEPRAESAPALQAWIEEMAGFVKSIDKKHLVTSGSEGFFGKSTPDLTRYNPGSWASAHGVDFVRNHDIPDIDFGVFHLYADLYLNSCEMDCALRFSEDYVQAHLTSGLRKPILLEEVGKKGEGRDEYLEVVLRKMHDDHIGGGYGAGTVIWQLSPSNFSDVDSFAIYLPEHESTSSLVKSFGVRVALRMASAFHNGMAVVGWMRQIVTDKIRNFYGNRFWAQHILPAGSNPSVASFSNETSDPVLP
ncbi:glycoside hydrolase [Chloropicon primus]|uniref:mannan endo-1,4-beta-mannosidase n=1 Tax=Chloropicon primus TaxID=1764295 RepID=A0A5B8MEE5_9CHLO|nr:glycoside hydrolase [Chloropicon primus]UPQ96888.1 glycoside hydrolase [Chloropicon primus]|eukprot:QDZ17672.1 glycoside hydrolase [Chloropicon primus]